MNGTTTPDPSFIWTFLLRIIDNTTSQNIYYSSWNTLYIKARKSIKELTFNKAAAQIIDEMTQQSYKS
jgi:hypothetical protein